MAISSDVVCRRERFSAWRSHLFLSAPTDGIAAPRINIPGARNDIDGYFAPFESCTAHSKELDMKVGGKYYELRTRRSRLSRLIRGGSPLAALAYDARYSSRPQHLDSGLR